MTGVVRLVSRCRDVVETIRREEFGIGMVLNDDAKKLLAIQQERLGRSLDRLSKDLYSKDTHFVLELIQNADDNTYPDSLLETKSKTGPSLQFVVNDESITVLNNETGFLEKNVRAICDVGKSTKGKHSGGYIGQKGIGFKSVFRISDRPEIHSNGYHIYFDVKSGPMGYILPHWAEEDVKENDWMTKIVLPMKLAGADSDAQQVRSLANRFYDIHPSLLLFLRRLRQIVIVHENDDQVLKMSRRDVGKNVIEIKHNQGTDRWLVVKKRLDASKISLQAKSGVDIASTDVALAFPILSAGENAAAPVLPPKQPLFAFLPLRSYGFRFVVQGDFDVPSSREDVDSDSTWNQWLRSEIPTVFVEAMDVFTTHPSLELLEGVLAYLRFVPMEDELLDFFKPVASQILRRLRSKPCLPVVATEGDALPWRLPSQIIVCHDQHVLELISAKILEEHLGLFYLHPKVAKGSQLPLLKSLGVKTLNTDHLLEVGRSLMRMWMDKEEKADVFPADVVSDIARWFVCVARSLDDFGDHKDNVRYIQTLDLMPLADGSMTSLERSTVFFPPEESDDEFVTMRLLSGDFSMLDPRLTSCLDHVSNLLVRQLLTKLGVREATPRDIVQYHVLPALKSDQWKEKERPVLEAYVHHIRHLYLTNPSDLDLSDVTSCLRLWTNQGPLNPSSEPIHFSSYYGNPVDLEKSFPGQQWILLDKSYLRRDMSPANVQGWRRFLHEMGVRDFLHVVQVTEQKLAGELGETPFAHLADELRDADGPFTVTDFVSREFLALVEAADYDHVTQMSVLVKLVNEHFAQYRDKSRAELRDREGKNCQSADSSFKTHLRTKKWLPGRTVSYANVCGSLTCERDVRLYSSAELFLPQVTLRRCLGDHVPFLQTNLTEKTEFLTELGVTHTLNSDLMVEFLLKWSSRKFVTEPAEFVTTVEHMRTVYAFLHDHMPRNTLRTIFAGNALVFVPRKAFVQDDDVTVGDFHRLDDVIWEDPTGIFFKHSEKLKHEKVLTLSKFYPDLQPFFLDLLNVRKLPTLLNYVEALKMAAEPYVSHGSNVRDCLCLMEFVGRSLREMEDENRAETVAELRVKLKGHRFVPLKRGIFVGLEDGPMIPDTQLLDKFSDEDQEDLINVVAMETVEAESKQKMKITANNIKYDEEDLRFLESMGVVRASSRIEQSYTHTDAAESQHLQIYFHKIIPALQIFLYNEYAECHRQLQDDGMAEKFAEMGFYQVTDLRSVYTLAGTTARHQKKEKVLIYGAENALYIHERHMDAFSDLHRELARYLGYGDSTISSAIREFVTDLLPSIQGERVVDVAALCRQREWTPVPAEEPQWIVEEPLEPEPEPEVEVEEMAEDDADSVGDPGTEILDQDEPLDHVTRSDDEEEVGGHVVGHVAWPPVERTLEKREGKRRPRRVLSADQGHLDMRNAVPLYRGPGQQAQTLGQSPSSLPPLPVSTGRGQPTTSQDVYQSATRPANPFDESSPDQRTNLWGPRPVYWMSEWPPTEKYIGSAPMGWIGPWPPRREPWGEKPDGYNGLWPPPAYAVGTPPASWATAWPPRATIWGRKPDDWKGEWPPPSEYVGPAPSSWLGPWPPSSAWMTGHAEIWQMYGGQDSQTSQPDSNTETKTERRENVPDQSRASSYWLIKRNPAQSEDADHWEEVANDEKRDHEHYKYEKYDNKWWRKQIPSGVPSGGSGAGYGLTFGPWEIFDGRDFDEYLYEYACVEGYDYRRKIVRPRPRMSERRGKEPTTQQQQQQHKQQQQEGDDRFGPWEAHDGSKEDEDDYEYYEEGGYRYRRRRQERAPTAPSSGVGHGSWEPCDSTMTHDEEIFEYCQDNSGENFRRRRSTGSGPRWELCRQSADINDARYRYHMEGGKLYRCRAQGDETPSDGPSSVGEVVRSDSGQPAGRSAADPSSTKGIPKGVRHFTAKTSPTDLDLSKVMEDIALGREVVIPRHVRLDSAQGMTQLGRYGESLVYHHLKQSRTLLEGYTTAEIIWVNETDERGDPFDIVLRLVDERSRALVEIFVEVKATMAEDKDLFEITGREVEFAYKKGESYHLYRVYNANNPEKVRIARIKNLAMKIDQKLVKLCMVI